MQSGMTKLEPGLGGRGLEVPASGDLDLRRRDGESGDLDLHPDGDGDLGDRRR